MTGVGLYFRSVYRSGSFVFHGTRIYCFCLLFLKCHSFEAICSSGWMENKHAGTCVKLFYGTKSTWYYARMACKSYDADLLKIYSSEENTFITDLYKLKTPKAFIGLHKQANSFVFKWLDNIKARFVKWHNRVPTYDIGQMCTVLNLQSRTYGNWTTRKCSLKTPYICEKGPELCPNGSLPSPNSGTCITLIDERREWSSARGVCQQTDGDLVTILNEKLNQFILDQVENNKAAGYWIGLTYNTRENKYMWLNTETQMPYSNLLQNETRRTDLQHEACTYIDRSGEQNRWRLENCHQLKNYVCENFADCEYEKYGTICPQRCSSCPTCNLEARHCPRHCEPGYQGYACTLQCSNRTYGAQCSKDCSDRCGGPSKLCHHVDGSCLNGCIDGYKGAKCDTACEDERYGANCTNLCNFFCGGPKNDCNHTNGLCLLGCDDGYEGNYCNISIDRSPNNHNYVYSDMAKVASVTFAFIIFSLIVLSFYARPEPESAELHFEGEWEVNLGTPIYSETEYMSTLPSSSDFFGAYTPESASF
ncbi:hypothetical protein RRG08_050339 [Elysia crispata]|uniref:C-type lectin domain-containing protein n=1 Tax=Elysia crispata TaxID=231223 RepID=A0AAE1A0R7_9GAST|nr:hypothetical protein RRG08_050339 [Elysia crispata]